VLLYWYGCFYVQSVTLRWDAPSSLTSPETGADCPVLKYLIRLRQDGVRKSRAWKLEPDRLSVSLHDLRPETQYKASRSFLETFTACPYNIISAAEYEKS